MKAEISLITIWTDNIEEMKGFYKGILGFEIINDLGGYVEFRNDGVRFAICKREVMFPYSEKYREGASGQAFELAFPCSGVDDINEAYRKFEAAGVNCIKEPTDMPWGQRTALFADPDGNVHEIFTEL